MMNDIELLERLVSFDSTSCNSNLPMADFLCDYLDGPEVTITRNSSADGTKTNLVVRRGAVNPDRAGLILSGHMDVVPAVPEDWQSDPFVMTRKDDALVGRGTADMKGFLALAANALVSFDATHARAPLVLIFTFDEEVGTLGAKRLVDTWDRSNPLPRQTIIGEPTSLRPLRMHKGHLHLRISTTGVSAHSALPQLGRNAIEPVGHIVSTLATVRRQLEQERPPHSEWFPQVPFLVINLAQIHGGTAFNVVPDRCVLEIGVRTLPGTDVPALIERFRAAIRPKVPDDGYTVEVVNHSPPLQLDERAPIYRAVCAISGHDHQPGAAYATDAGWMQSLGLDCVIFGPGSIEVAHKPNESIPVAELVRGRDHLAQLIHTACVALPT
jgi:acetylornithine deacetylase